MHCILESSGHLLEMGHKLDLIFFKVREEEIMNSHVIYISITTFLRKTHVFQLRYERRFCFDFIYTFPFFFVPFPHRLLK